MTSPRSSPAHMMLGTLSQHYDLETHLFGHYFPTSMDIKCMVSMRMTNLCKLNVSTFNF